MPGHAQEGTTVTAPATKCIGGVWPINCDFNGGTPQEVRIYIAPSGGGASYVQIPAENVGAQVTSFTPTTLPGQIFPSTITITFQGGTFWDGDEYVQLTGTATMTLTYKRAFPSGRNNPWIATATLVSMTYTF
jgi:hypothetical protein